MNYKLYQKKEKEMFVFSQKEKEEEKSLLKIKN